MRSVSLTLQRSGLLTMERVASLFGRGRKMPAHLRTGERGELEALFFLRSRGYIVVARRWRSPELNGDLDLVAWQGETLCFIEVKARTARDQTPATLAIDRSKRQMLSRMARAYLRTLPRPRRQSESPAVLTRFDFVSVYLLPGGTEFELLEDAFPWRDWRNDGKRAYGV